MLSELKITTFVFIEKMCNGRMLKTQTLNNYKLIKNRTNMISTVPEIMVNYKKIDKGFIAQCPDNPQFLVQTKSKIKIKVEMKEMIEDYVQIFPKEKKIILPEGNDFRIVLNEK